MKRYFLSTDQDCHWFLVPVDKRNEWREWASLDGDNEESWSAPEWAFPVNGSPSRITFEAPELDHD